MPQFQDEGPRPGLAASPPVEERRARFVPTPVRGNRVAMTILDVPYPVLVAARDRWDATGDELDGARKRLAGASVTHLAARLALVVGDFCRPWAAELRELADRAGDHAGEFVFFHRRVVVVDEAQADLVRSLLPWSEHDAGRAGRP